MKKTIAAVTAGLLLVAGQAVAANTTQPVVGDRLGAAVGDSEEFSGGVPVGLIFAALAVGAFVVFADANDDESESD